MSGTDFNDLHVNHGIDAVRAQLESVLAANDGGAVDSVPVSAIPVDDEFYDRFEPSHALPEKRGGFGRWTFPEMVENISLIYGTDMVWDAREGIQMKLSHLRHIVGREMFKLWDETPLRKIVRGMVFEPSGVIPEFTVNLFSGFAIAPGTQGARGCPRILQHIYRLCGMRDDEFEWLVRWMAYPLQNPGAKMATSVVMHGDEGTGKSLIWDEVIGKIYGDYMITVGQLQIESAFTGWQSKRCLALCEEVVARNEKAHYKGMLKHLVTGRTLVINEKNMPARSETNHMNSVFLSNSMNPLELDLGDRRYMVLFITDVPDQAYFDALMAEINNGGVEEFYQHLITLDMKGFHTHTKPPMNVEKQHLIEAGMPNAVLFFNDWRDGQLGIPFGPCSKASLYDAYKRWCEQKNEFKRRDRDVAAELRRYLVEDKHDIRLPDDFKERKTHRCWVPKDIYQLKGSDDYARTIEVHCQKFLGAFNA